MFSCAAYIETACNCLQVESELLCRLELSQSFLEGGMEGLKKRCLAAEQAAVSQAHTLQQWLASVNEQARAALQTLGPDMQQVRSRSAYRIQLQVTAKHGSNFPLLPPLLHCTGAALCTLAPVIICNGSGMVDVFQPMFDRSSRHVLLKTISGNIRGSTVSP